MEQASGTQTNVELGDLLRALDDCRRRELGERLEQYSYLTSSFALHALLSLCLSHGTVSCDGRLVQQAVVVAVHLDDTAGREHMFNQITLNDKSVVFADLALEKLFPPNDVKNTEVHFNVHPKHRPSEFEPLQVVRDNKAFYSNVAEPGCRHREPKLVSRDVSPRLVDLYRKYVKLYRCGRAALEALGFSLTSAAENETKHTGETDAAAAPAQTRSAEEQSSLEAAFFDAFPDEKEPAATTSRGKKNKGGGAKKSK